ncbi:hypothetical protein T484DRAFT_1851836 [Baffinella frigidus]|nr:hypothetical protein T484DRAFT_1851836 [Cryptophyta sp. CCMP2293]
MGVLVALVRIAPSLFGILTHAGHLPSDVAAEVSAKLFIRHLESICKTTPSRPPSFGFGVRVTGHAGVHEPAGGATPGRY